MTRMTKYEARRERSWLPKRTGSGVGGARPRICVGHAAQAYQSMRRRLCRCKRARVSLVKRTLPRLAKPHCQDWMCPHRPQRLLHSAQVLTHSRMRNCRCDMGRACLDKKHQNLVARIQQRRYGDRNLRNIDYRMSRRFCYWQQKRRGLHRADCHQRSRQLRRRKPHADTTAPCLLLHYLVPSRLLR